MVWMPYDSEMQAYLLSHTKPSTFSISMELLLHYYKKSKEVAFL